MLFPDRLPVLPVSRVSSNAPPLWDCCAGKVIQHRLTFCPYPPHHLSFSSPSVHKHIWCMLMHVCAMMFVCREVMWCGILFLISPSCPLGCKAKIFCVYACWMSDLLSYFYCRWSLHAPPHSTPCHTHTQVCTHTHAHTLGWKTKVTLWLRLLCSALEGQKAFLLFLEELVIGTFIASASWTCWLGVLLIGFAIHACEFLFLDNNIKSPNLR